jgi:hypothetical protein
MQFPHLFEWMDLAWLPTGLRNTLRDILECGNARPFRPYYNWVAAAIKQQIDANGYQNIVELGAGTAPITRILAKDKSLAQTRLFVCDLKPDMESFHDLAERYPGHVIPIEESVDFGQPRVWPPSTLLFLSGTFHHIPDAQRSEVLHSLSASADRIMVFEPLRKTLSSVFFVLLSLVPALVLPLWFINRPGRLRRVFWCWILPLGPLCFWWDGIVSCLRMWDDRRWREEVSEICNPATPMSATHSFFSQLVTWSCGREQGFTPKASEAPQVMDSQPLEPVG